MNWNNKNFIGHVWGHVWAHVWEHFRGHVWGTVLLILTGWLIVTGCASRQHMSNDFGQQTMAFRAQQRVHSDVSSQPPSGLDSEEAALVHQTYRQNMGGSKSKQSTDPSSRVILLQNPEKK